MSAPRWSRTAVSTLLGIAWTWPAAVWGLGLGQPESRAVLGETLRVALPLRLEAGETVTQECVSAEVAFGDAQLPATAVTLELLPAETVTQGMGARLVLRTTALINEPLVHVRLSAGCQARISRRFVVLADPPGFVAAPAVLPDASPVPAASQDVADRAPKGATQPTRASSPRLASLPSSKLITRDKRQPTPKVGARRAAPAPAAQHTARLALDPVDADAWVQPSLRPSVQMRVPDEAAQAASDVQARREAAAALWRALNATPEVMLRQQRQVQELEQRLKGLQRDGAQMQQNVAALQGRMQALESRSALAGGAARSWSWPLAGGALALLGALAWAIHAWGVRRGRGQALAWWRPDEVQAAVDQAPADRVPADHAASALDEDLLGAIPEPDPEDIVPGTAWPLASASQPAPSATLGAAPIMPSSASPFVSADLAPDVPLNASRPRASAEELVDLEQQTEFFTVLGQDEAAIELLETHLAGRVSEVPWPYLKLMEIHRRLNARAEFDRLRERFQAHFGQTPPSWDEPLEQGRPLLAYPDVLAALQASWSAPEQALADIEDALVHQGPQATALDLPAYRDLLLLYTVARDLIDHVDRGRRARLPGEAVTPTASTPVIETLSVDLDLDRLQVRP